MSGSVAAMTDIAIREKVSDSYVKKVMPLAFLAPDIIAAILAGRQPADLTNQKLICEVEISLDWQEQRRGLGFPPCSLKIITTHENGHRRERANW